MIQIGKYIGIPFFWVTKYTILYGELLVFLRIPVRVGYIEPCESCRFTVLLVVLGGFFLQKTGMLMMINDNRNSCTK